MTKNKLVQPEEATSVKTEVVQDLPGELAMPSAIPAIAEHARHGINQGEIMFQAGWEVWKTMWAIYREIKKL